MAECMNFKIGREFLKKHNWPIALSNAVHNRCYCSNCYSAELEDTFIVGGHTYVVPRGWTRFGVSMNEGIAEHLDIWKTWANCFHGTSIENAKSIVENQMLLIPGEVTMEGKKIVIPPGHIPKQYFFFTTPTIKYAGNTIYTKRYNFKSEENGQQYKVKVVLQCKQKPDSFIVQRETIGAYKRRICRYIPNAEMEWKTEQRGAIMPYGMLLYINHNGKEEISPMIPPPTSDQISCPHCWESNVWKHSKRGVVITCVHKTCKKNFQPFNCPHCSLFHVKKDHEGISVCSNDHCQREFLQHKCPSCSGLNVWKIADKNQAVLVTCSYKGCNEKFQLHKCPHCESMTFSKDVSYKNGVALKCCKFFQLVNCPHCSNLNVLEDAYAKAGRSDIVTCAYKQCNKTFKQPLQLLHK